MLKEKLGFIITVSIPIMLIGGYFLWASYIVKQSGKSLKNVTNKTIENQIKKHAKKDEYFIDEEILRNNKRANFTGIEKRNDTTFTNVLHIKYIDSISLEYRIEILINWKSEEDKTGIAILDKSSIKNEKGKIKNRKGILVSAYRFIEDKGDCQVEILISKENYTESIAIVKEICKDQSKFITVKMNYK